MRNRAASCLVLLCTVACARSNAPAEVEPNGLGEEPAPPEEEPVPPEEDVPLEVDRFDTIWGTADDDIWLLGRPVPPPEREAEPSGGVTTINPIGVCIDYDGATWAPRVIRHFDGKTWWRRTSDMPAIVALHGTAAHDVWAVGHTAVIHHFDGSRWTEADASAEVGHEDAKCAETSLYDVWAAAPDAVWAVGFASRNERWDSPGLILHFDGRVWTRQPVDARDGFRAVWGSARDDVWAVGSAGAFHYDGERWTESEVPVVQPLRSVWGSGPRDVWTVSVNQVLLHFDGDRWETGDALPGYEVDALTGSGPSDVFAAALTNWHERDNPTQLWHWDGESWKPQDLDPELRIAALWMSPSGQLWGAGKTVSVLRPATR